MFVQWIDLWSEDLAWVWIASVPRQAALILGVALLIRCYPRMAAAWRHWIWLVAALAIGLVPLAAMVLPGLPLIPAEWVYGADAAAVSVSKDSSAAVLSPESSGMPYGDVPLTFGWVEWFFLGWFAGVFLLLARLGMGLMGLRSFQRERMPVVRGRLCARLEQCRSVGKVSTLVDLYLSKRSPLPMTWGVLRPAINLPEEAEEWSDERLDAVFLHELAHIQRSDCWTNMVLKVVCALNWFNPFVWMAARRTYLAQEVACDDFACGRLRPSNYARHLLELTAVVKDFHRREIEPAVGLSSCDHLRLRVAAALDPERSRACLPSRMASLMSGAVFLSMGLMAMVSLRFVDEARASAVDGPLVMNMRVDEGDVEVLDAMGSEEATGGLMDLAPWFKELPGAFERVILRGMEVDESRQESSLLMPVVSENQAEDGELVSEEQAHREKKEPVELDQDVSVPLMAAPSTSQPSWPQVVRAMVVPSPSKMPQRVVVPAKVTAWSETEESWWGFGRSAGSRRGYSVVLNHAQSVCNRYARLSPTDRWKQGGFRNYLKRNGVYLSDTGIRQLIDSTRR